MSDCYFFRNCEILLGLKKLVVLKTARLLAVLKRISGLLHTKTVMQMGEKETGKGLTQRAPSELRRRENGLMVKSSLKSKG